MAHLGFIFRSFPWGLLTKVYLKLINEILWPSARSRPWGRVSKGLPGSCHYCFDASREALNSIAANLHLAYVGLGIQKGLPSYPGLFVGVWSFWNWIFFLSHGNKPLSHTQTLPNKTKQQTTFLMYLQGSQVPTPTTFPMTVCGAGCFHRKEHYPLSFHGAWG